MASTPQNTSRVHGICFGWTSVSVSNELYSLKRDGEGKYSLGNVVLSLEVGMERVRQSSYYYTAK